jgi:hypothetical protein
MDEAEKFLEKQHLEEDEPISIEGSLSTHYYKLNSIFESFFPDDSLNLAKYTSKAEREQKSLNDSNYIYGEVVRKNYLNFINYKIKILFLIFILYIL